MKNRKLTSIWSLRKLNDYPSFRIVYDWEDIVAGKLNLTIKTDGKWKYKYFRRFEKNGITKLYHKFIRAKNFSLRFIMEARTRELCILDKNTIPVIIDFWLEEDDLPAFYKAYKNCPLVLVTSAEVVEFLNKNNCPLPIEHWPLSYPDNYKLDKSLTKDKQYEFCLFGRPNPFFIRLLDEYCAKHPDFTYIGNNGNIKHRQYINHRGEVVAEDTGRQSYLDMIRKTKISCYTTPGIDEAKKETSRYNQVTPRLFEMLINGCNVIGHYPDNADTRYYNLSDIVPNVDDYTCFEEVLDDMRANPVSIDRLETYMNQHYTSTRGEMLIDILKKHNISFD